MNVFISFLRLIRFPNLVIIFLTQYAIRYGIIYPFLEQSGLELFLDERLFGFLAMATVMIAAAGYIINDYFDVKLDSINKPTQLIIGQYIGRRQSMLLHILLNAIGLSLALYIAIQIGHPILVIIQLSAAILLWYYSVNFKKKILTGNIIIAALTALVPFTAGYYEVVAMFDELTLTENTTLMSTKGFGSLLFSIKYLLYWIFGYSTFAFLLSMIREIIKDCEDIEGDRAFDCKTLPIVHGIDTAKKTAFHITIFTTLLVAIVQYMQLLSKDWPSLAYFFILITLPLLFTSYRIWNAHTKRHFFIISQTIKLIMLSGILYILVIYGYAQ
ncbi:MAG: hypothetical protein CMO34_01180 [Verrucomicrobia bacterium]|nr:hypothetical protein [Verrucomicrobiota bacterium]